MPAEVASKVAKKPAAPSPRDDGESVYLLEPMRISEENDARPELTELVLDLTKRSASPRSTGAMEPSRPAISVG